ncbi:hypothetical protein H4696_002433 [Amycolatopsis lexingtonensis]|uniref:DUF1508 domain-containing protein n=1 Tax=Amycolatopsis lexingtonensis TaxID=218822 RepID=A0ABR9HWM3_9PSEU|nr:hypothetical protein [Amycolatopsis lexingtonensis]MBE1495333.1 hypothetical protein [Amycolatopsis lexingtonensis]
MKDFWFEIFATEEGRYGWVFFSGRRGQQRELARSTRLYKSAGKTRRAIGKLRGARIGRPFTLPRTTFEFVPGVVPLTAKEAATGGRPVAAAERAAGKPRRKPAEPAEPKGKPRATRTRRPKADAR